MNIPDEALEEFKCSSCESYLSQSPVFQQHDGAAVCSRCHSPERPASRNKQYESAARFLRFPCKNRDLGCRDTVPYATQQGPNTHEEVCAYRQYVCPVLGSSRCDWLGPRSDILKHCRAKHPDRVRQSPCVLEHDISRSSVNTYVLCALRVLFLLHTKICVTTGKLYHAVRFLGASDEAVDYSYTLDIRRGDVQISLKGQVAEQGCLAIQEPTSLALDTNSLLSVLGGFDEAMFTVAVKGRLCTKCGARLATLLYRDDEGWRCERCAPAARPCENQVHGCQYKDIDDKCYKHELYFCEQRTWCDICEVNVSRGAMLAHYGSMHIDINVAGSTWRAKYAECCGGQYSLRASCTCMYWFGSDSFELDVLTPMMSAQLSKHRCVVRLTIPATGCTRSFTLEPCYNTKWDWNIKVESTELFSWSGELDVCVEITKIEL